MNVKSPRPIHLKGTREEAVLLLHSFTGTIRDIKHLATVLNEEGYTCYAPNYRGHGLPLKAFTQFTINDWWDDVREAYQFLKHEGFETIYVTGVSLGGLFTLKLAETVDVAKIAVMSAPNEKEEAGIAWRLERYGKRMNELLNFDETTAQEQMNQIEAYRPNITVFKNFISNISAHLGDIKTPARILYGEKDEQSYQDSARYIYEHINSQDKDLSNHLLCKHLMTHGEGSENVEREIAEFFKSN
ncbi:alpha/beta fold hydrolase [Staphylococcus sp. NRL 16/872]|uniref:alpha/beta hydrolase n=1 Tax=Staphylococcus sp. NRL 16/872 TaxID=2930131 RepID=UPI001FB48F8C|nr:MULTISPECIES: alpha/beta fold hydrolase [unclassified Staphylococcus]MCJ1662918.1 alpha/beta fold hydrolase [Staphylococcus sp. NRL 18/288]WEN69264.1 alpha/beta fold hydrolase [Staphylococcus sp. NRL 16/872]